MSEHDTLPPTDPLGTEPPPPVETEADRTAGIFGAIVAEELAKQLEPVRSSLGTIVDEQQVQSVELRGLAEQVTGLTARVRALETRRQILPLLLATAALAIGFAALGTVALRPHVVVPVMMGGQ